MNIADVLTRLEIEPVNSGACGAGWRTLTASDVMAMKINR